VTKTNLVMSWPEVELPVRWEIGIIRVGWRE
jgi:hypothetical protein